MFDDGVRQVLAQQKQMRQAMLAVNQIPQEAIRAVNQIPQEAIRAVNQIPQEAIRAMVQAQQDTIRALSQYPQDTFRYWVQIQQDLFRGIQGSREAISHLGNSSAHMIASWQRRQQMEAEFIAKIGTTTVDVPIVPPQPVESIDRIQTPTGPPARFPAAWEMLTFLLPKRVRVKVYEPVRAELLEDYVRSRQYKGRAARFWISGCFGLRTTVAIIGCLLVWAREPAVRLIVGWLPAALRDWWMQANSGD